MINISIEESIFYRKNEELLQDPSNLKNYLDNADILYPEPIITGIIEKCLLNIDTCQDVYACLYTDRLEIYENQLKDKLLTFVVAQNTTIVLGNSQELINLQYDFSGFILSNAKQSQTYFFKNSNQYGQWLQLLQKVFIQNLKKFKTNYILKKKLGFGGSATVYLAKNWFSNKQVAVKVIPKAKAKNVKYLEVINEIQCLKFSDYKNFLKLYEIIEGERNLYLIMEYFPEGDLFKLVQENQLSENDALQILKGLAKQLYEFKQYGILHGDIKLENIMIRKLNRNQYKPILIDFGFAQLNYMKHPDKKIDSLIGTIGYSAPEMLLDYNFENFFTYTEKTEVFSLGIVLYCLLYQRFPFKLKNQKELIIENIECKIDYEAFPKEISNQSIDLIKKMLELNYEARLTLDQIFSHSVLQPKRNLKIKNFIIKNKQMPGSKKLQNTSQKDLSNKFKVQNSPRRIQNFSQIISTTATPQKSNFRSVKRKKEPYSLKTIQPYPSSKNSLKIHQRNHKLPLDDDDITPSSCTSSKKLQDLAFSLINL